MLVGVELVDFHILFSEEMQEISSYWCYLIKSLFSIFVIGQTAYHAESERINICGSYVVIL